jgi:CBS domain containing-hemolysin-like protein
MVPLVLVFGEFLPKSLARAHANQLTLRLALPLRVAELILSPVVAVVARIAGLLTDITGKGAADKRSKAFASRDDLRLVTQMATEQGVLAKSTGTLLAAVLNLESRPLREWMTPLAQAQMLTSDATVAELQALALRTAQTHIPVYEGDRSHIVGAVDLRDVLYATFGDLRRLREDRGQDSIRAHVQRNVLHVPDDQSVGTLLQELRYHQTPILVLRDAAGNTVGLVAVTTLLNVLFRPERRSAPRAGTGTPVS